MKKALLWTCRIIVGILVLPSLILGIPGLILHIVTEELIEP